MAEIKTSILQRTAIATFLNQFQVGHRVRYAEALERHRGRCQVCREGLKPDYTKGEMTWAIKNRVTREYLHVIAEYQSEAVERLGWQPEDVATAVVTNMQSSKDADGKKKMPEHIKARLKQINKQRREEKKLERAATRARGDIDSMSKVCYTTPGSKTNPKPKGGDIMATENLASWVKGFIEGQISEKNKDGKEVFNMNLLFDLAKANDVDSSKLSKYKKDLEPETAGRIRMTVGNMIRGAAAKNGKLLTLGGGSKIVPDGLIPPKKEKKAPKKTVAKKNGKKTAKAA